MGKSVHQKRQKKTTKKERKGKQPAEEQEPFTWIRVITPEVEYTERANKPPQTPPFRRTPPRRLKGQRSAPN